MADNGMYDDAPSVIAEYFCIGFNHYVSKSGSEGLFLHILENYSGQNPNQVGSFGTNLRAPYDQRRKFTSLAVPPAVSRPARIKLKGHMSVFQGQNSFECDEILEVVPFKQSSSVMPDMGSKK